MAFRFMKCKTAYLIVNPRSGQNFAKLSDILAVFSAAGWKTDVAVREFGGHTMKLATEGAEAGYDLVIGYGGDGTLNQVVNGVMGAKARRGIVLSDFSSDFCGSSRAIVSNQARGPSCALTTAAAFSISSAPSGSRGCTITPVLPLFSGYVDGVDCPFRPARPAGRPVRPRDAPLLVSRDAAHPLRFCGLSQRQCRHE